MMQLSSSIGARWVGFGVAPALAELLAVGVLPAEAKKKQRPAPPVAQTEEDRDEARGACSRSLNALFSACRTDLAVASFETRAVCVNLADAEDRAQCLDEIGPAREDGATQCRAQRDARRALCAKIGEAPYEPDMDPALFQAPRNPRRSNRFFPLDVGNRWVYQDSNERIEIEVLNKTKRASGVDCLVVNDRVFVAGSVVEDTDDWVGLRTDGTVEYCGELSRNYELTAGDDPQEVELVAIDGTFKTGVDGAKSGTLFMGTPVVGTTYRQEWAAGVAEDVGTVLSTTYRYGQSASLDQLVPRALAELMCANGDCVVIADTSTLDPSGYEQKYFAPGVGKFLETKPRKGTVVPLIACNVNARCTSLPLP